MQFCDEVKVTFLAGKGGNGCVSFRREKYVPRGGPDGGDGGNGGSIVLEVDPNVNTLFEFKRQKVFRAENGEPGKGKNQHGRSGGNLVLKVPPGTLTLDETKKVLLKDLTECGEKFTIVRGGRGGYGNAHFTSSTRQKPRFAELGEPGEEKTIFLELKLVADIGIIGLPSVGKSTLLSRISNARPKIAPYPFTTLVPNLGIVTLDRFGGKASQGFVACDLPGLIEDASKGKGLGIEFLKHVARNRALIHLLDIARNDLKEDYETIRKELKQFDKKLLKKKEIIAINKIDISPADEVFRKIKKAFPRKELFFISCVTRQGIRELIFAVWKILEKLPKEKVLFQKRELTGYRVYRPHLEDPRAFWIEEKRKRSKNKGTLFVVRGKRIEQIVVMTDFQSPEAISRVYDVFDKMGVQRELQKLGASEGDEIEIHGKLLTYHAL